MTVIQHNAYAGNASSGYEWKTEPHWRDLQGSVAEGSGGAALTFAAFRDTPFKLASFRNAQNDELHMVYQMPHAWVPGTEIHPHIHVVPLTDPAAEQVVRFDGYYVFVAHGSEVPALASWTVLRADLTLQVGAVNKPRIVPLAVVTPPASSVESDMLLLYVKRSGSDAVDTYTGNLAVLSVDAHLQVQKMGTLTEFLGAQP